MYRQGMLLTLKGIADFKEAIAHDALVNRDLIRNRVETRLARGRAAAAPGNQADRQRASAGRGPFPRKGSRPGSQLPQAAEDRC